MLQLSRPPDNLISRRMAQYKAEVCQDGICQQNAMGRISCG